MLGVVGSFTLANVSDLASIGAAVATIIYMAVCTVKKCQKNKNKSKNEN